MENKITVPASKKPDVLAALAKLVKRAVKLKVAAPTIIVSAPYKKHEKEAAVIDITIQGGPIVLPGYEFIAHNEFGKDGNLIFVRPGKVLEDKFRHSNNFCDHCETKRARKELYVFQDTATGKQIQVGKQCLRAYMGVEPSVVLLAASWDKTIKEIDEDSWGRGGNGFYVSLKELLAYTAAVIEYEGGYISATAANNTGVQSTSSKVNTAMWPNIKSDEALAYSRIIRAMVTDDLNVKAEKAIDWSVNDWKSDSDYAHNLRTIARAGDVTSYKAMPFALSLYPAYLREMGRLAEIAVQRKLEAAKLKDSEHVGNEKDRLRNLPADVFVAKFIGEGAWGDKYLYKFLDAKGNAYVWWSTAQGLNKGDKVLLTGTVKSHKEYQGAKETLLSRCKVEIVEKVA